MHLACSFKKKLLQSLMHFKKFKGFKSNRICVDKGSKFSNKSMKSHLQTNNAEMYSTRNE